MVEAEARQKAHERAIEEAAGYPDGAQRDALIVKLEERFFRLLLVDHLPSQCS